MEVLYLLSFIFIIYSFLRIKKSNNKLNLLLWIFISIMVYMGFNSIIIYILSLIDIKSTLLIRSIINIIMSIIMFINRDKQEYYVDKIDVGIIILLLYFSLIIFFVRFGIKFNISFEMDDATIHFAEAKTFALNNTLVDKIPNIIYGIIDYKMFFGYTNAGTFMQILMPITGNINMYKSFIIFEMLSFYMSGVLLYFIVKSKNVSYKDSLKILIFIIMYCMGYPLANLLYGFHYWGIIILLISSIILVFKEIDINNMYKNKVITLILFILSTSIFLTYYLYVPVVYLCIGLYLIYLWKIKEISLKRTIRYILVILVIPFIFGLIYYSIISEYFRANLNTTSMNIEGPNYKDLIGNFIFLLPLIIYEIINELRLKKINLITILAISNFIYTVILFILCISGKMSTYYYGKIYNLSWLILYIYLIKVLLNENNLIINLYIYTYLIIVVLACFNIEEVINNKRPEISNNTIISNIGNIYDNNIKIFNSDTMIIDSDLYELLTHSNNDEYKNVRGEIPFITTPFRKMWIAQILDVVPNNNYLRKGELWANNMNNIIMDNGTLYFVWIPDKSNINLVKLNDYEIIYENNSGYILKKIVNN